MSLHSRIAVSVSPLLWLAPLPFVLAMCLPLELHTSNAEPTRTVATAPEAAQPIDHAASAAHARH